MKPSPTHCSTNRCLPAWATSSNRRSVSSTPESIPRSRLAHPRRAAAAITSARKLLRPMCSKIQRHDRDLSRQQRRTTHASDPSQSLWVYGRNGEPCRRCGEPIRRRIQGADARVTFWCRVASPCRMVGRGWSLKGTTPATGGAMKTRITSRKIPQKTNLPSVSTSSRRRWPRQFAPYGRPAQTAAHGE